VKERLFLDLFQQVKEIEVDTLILDDLKEEITKSIAESLVSPGEMCGVIAAQSIGAPVTQLVLNAFHSSGISGKTVTTGVPRFQELINATKSPKCTSCTVYYNERPTSIQSLRTCMDNRLLGVPFQELISDVRLINSEYKHPSWYIPFDVLYQYSPWTELEHGIHLVLNKEKLYQHKITTKDLANTIKETWGDLFPVHSPLNIAELDVYVDTSEITLGEEGIVTEDKKEEYYSRDVAIPKLLSQFVKGIKEITAIYPTKKENEEWCVETDGSSFQQILNLEEVDFSRTLCNDMWEIYNTLGVEAARSFIISEMTEVIGNYIDRRHIMLLVDQMTFSGTIKAVTRNGINRKVGPLAKASFEEALDNFLKAATLSETDKTDGVSSAVMVGKQGRFGSGLNNILLDVKEIMKIPLQKVHKKVPRKVIFNRLQARIQRNRYKKYIYLYCRNELNLKCVRDLFNRQDLVITHFKHLTNSHLYEVEIKNKLNIFKSYKLNGTEHEEGEKIFTIGGNIILEYLNEIIFNDQFNFDRKKTRRRTSSSSSSHKPIFNSWSSQKFTIRLKEGDEKKKESPSYQPQSPSYQPQEGCIEDISKRMNDIFV